MSEQSCKEHVCENPPCLNERMPSSGFQSKPYIYFYYDQNTCFIWLSVVIRCSPLLGLEPRSLLHGRWLFFLFDLKHTWMFSLILWCMEKLVLDCSYSGRLREAVVGYRLIVVFVRRSATSFPSTSTHRIRSVQVIIDRLTWAPTV